MAETISLTEAARVLKEHFGEKLEGGHDEGLDLMADTLHEHFNLSAHDAKKIVKDLVEARSVRWVPANRPTILPIGSPNATGVPIGAANTEGAPMAAAEAAPSGYWQL